MMRAPALLLLLAVAAAGGAWWYASPRERPVAECDTADSCSAGDWATAAPSSGTPAETESPEHSGPAGASSQPPATPDPSEPHSADPAKAAEGPSDAAEGLSAAAAGVVDAIKLREDADRFLREGNVAEALDALKRATEANPTARNHGDLGDLLLKLTATDDALRHLRKAADLDSGNADRWISLANAYYRKVDLGEAWKAERRAREAEPGLVLGRDAHGQRIRRNDSAAGKP